MTDTEKIANRVYDRYTTLHECATVVCLNLCDGNKVTISYSYELRDDIHRKAAEALCAKMGWTGKLVSGSIKNGMVFVFVD